MIMFRSTFSSNTMRFDGAHRAEKIFVSILFACPAIALRNERDIDDLSMIPKSPDSLGKTALRHFHSPEPQALLYSFFFLYALKRQITESKNDQQHMPTPTGPASAFMMIQAQFLLQLVVSLLNPESFMKETNHLQGRHALSILLKKYRSSCPPPSFLLRSMISQTSSCTLPL